MKKGLFLAIVILMVSCSEKLVEKPDNLISKENMVDILSDLAIMNAAKSTNITILRDNDIDPTEFVFSIYGIDSVQFVESDKYYASIPSEYEGIYIAVESKLEKGKERFEKAKKLADSLKAEEFKLKRSIKKSQSKKIKDSLQ